MSPDSARVSLRDVAEAAGVSPTTVSFVMNNSGRVSPETARRIRQLATDMGYRGHPAARVLRTGKDNTFGLVVRNLVNPMFVDVIRGADAEARAAGVTLTVTDSNYERERELDDVQRLADRHIAGLGIAPVGGSGARRWWREHHADLPLVVVYGNHGQEEAALMVGPHHPTAVALAVDELAEAGHRRIVQVVGPEGRISDQQRETAFVERCHSHGAEPVTLRTVLDVGGTAAAVSGYLGETRPATAFVMNSDFTAAGVYLAASDRGLQIGRDVSVVGHDDLATSAILDPPLTTVAVDRAAIGVAFMQRLLGLADGDYRAPVELVRRRSVGPAA